MRFGDVVTNEYSADRTDLPADVLRPATTSVSRLDGLTGLRGLAVMVVFLSHGANAGFLPHYIGKGVGQFGVMLFFTLSGFLMGMLYMEKRPDQAMLRRYVSARLGRVLPLFYLIVALSVLAVAADIIWPYPISDRGTLARHLLLLSGTKELWAVPVEVQFYAIFLLIWSLCYRRDGLSTLRLGVAFLVLGSLFAAQVLAYHLDRMSFVTVLYYTPYFLTGILISLNRERISALSDLLSDAVLTFIALIAIVAFLLVNPNFRAGTALSMPLWVDPLVWTAMVVVFLCSLVMAGPFRWLAAAPMLFLGEVSYGFYLMHPIVLGWAEPLAASPSGFVRLTVLLLVGAISAGTAWLSLIWLERPALIRAKALA